jgi:hypothetical protein
VASGERFDSITRLLGGHLSRRQAIKLAIGGAVGTVGVVALQQRAADAACTQGVNCFAPSVCCPNTPFGDGVCAPPAFPQCCGTSSCAAFPTQQCCPGTNPANPAQSLSAPFCAPGPPVVCCGPIACAPGARCVGTGLTAPCCLAAAAAEGSTCCGPLPLGCPAGSTCIEYPPGTFNCSPVAPSDRNIKERVLPVAW